MSVTAKMKTGKLYKTTQELWPTHKGTPEYEIVEVDAGVVMMYLGGSPPKEDPPKNIMTCFEFLCGDQVLLFNLYITPKRQGWHQFFEEAAAAAEMEEASR